MAKAVDRVVIDTNLWVSFLITNDFKLLDERIIKGKLKILFSTELLEEFLIVVHRPKFRKYFGKEEIEQLMDLFEVYGEMVLVRSEVKDCRDVKDNFLLSLVKDSKADFLLTGDSDLLVMKEFHGTKIIRITDYISKFN
jgi:uncharacterized protein